MRLTNAESKFLDTIGIKNSEQDSVDVEYYKDVFWETWEIFRTTEEWYPM